MKSATFVRTTALDTNFFNANLQHCTISKGDFRRAFMPNSDGSHIIINEKTKFVSKSEPFGQAIQVLNKMKLRNYPEKDEGYYLRDYKDDFNLIETLREDRRIRIKGNEIFIESYSEDPEPWSISLQIMIYYTK